MRYFILSIFCLFMSNSLIAREQNIRNTFVNFSGGKSQSWFTGKDTVNIVGELSPINSFHAGISLLELDNRFYILPEYGVRYIVKGYFEEKTENRIDFGEAFLKLKINPNINKLNTHFLHPYVGFAAGKLLYTNQEDIEEYTHSLLLGFDYVVLGNVFKNGPANIFLGLQYSKGTRQIFSSSDMSRIYQDSLNLSLGLFF